MWLEYEWNDEYDEKILNMDDCDAKDVDMGYDATVSLDN